MRCDFKGILREVMPVRTYGASQIREREFRCEELGSFDENRGYPNTLAFFVRYDPTGDRYDNTDDILEHKIGDLIQFSFTVRGRRSKSKTDNQVRVHTDLRVSSKILPVTISDDAESSGDADQPPLRSSI